VKIAVCQRFCPEYIVPLFERLAARWDIRFFFSLYGKQHDFFFNPAVVARIPCTALTPPAFPLLPFQSRALNKLSVSAHVTSLSGQLVRALWHGDYDVMIGGDFGRFECVTAWAAARARRRAFVLWSDAWHWPVSRRDRLRRPLVRRMVKDAGAFLAGGSRAGAKLVELGASPGRIFNVFHTNVCAQPKPSAPASDGFGLYVGRLDERKGVEYLLRAFARIQPHAPAVRLKIAGVGPLQPHLERLSWELGVADAVDFLGWVDHAAVDTLYRDCALFVLPSIFSRDGGYEPFSNVVLEAMAWGRPVISTTANGASFDVIVSGVNGLVVPDRDVDALAGAVREILDDPERAAAMGLRAWETIRDDFNVDRMAERFSDALACVEAARARV